LGAHICKESVSFDIARIAKIAVIAKIVKSAITRLPDFGIHKILRLLSGYNEISVNLFPE